MITRSKGKKKLAEEFDEIKCTANKGQTKSAVEAEMDNQAPETADNVQLPVFNIHVHLPTTAFNSNKSFEFQPIIHVHIGEAVNKSPYNVTPENIDMADKLSKMELPSRVYYDFDGQNNSPGNMLLKPLKRNKICKRLSFSKSNRNSTNAKTEESKAVNSAAKTQENEDCLKSSFNKKKLPTRRSVRLANNQKLLNTLKDLSGGATTETKRKKSCSNINIENESNCSEKTLNLKEPIVVLNDISKMIKTKNPSFFDKMTDDKQNDCFNPNSMSAYENDSLQEVEKHSCNSLGESDNDHISKSNEENEKNFIDSGNNQNDPPVDVKFRDVYSLVYSSDNEANDANNTETDLADKCTFSYKPDINFQNGFELDESGYKTPLGIFVNDEKNSQINDDLLELEKHEVPIEIENDISSLLLKEQKESLNPKTCGVNYDDLNNDNVINADVNDDDLHNSNGDNDDDINNEDNNVNDDRNVDDDSDDDGDVNDDHLVVDDDDDDDDDDDVVNDNGGDDDDGVVNDDNVINDHIIDDDDDDDDGVVNDDNVINDHIIDDDDDGVDDVNDDNNVNDGNNIDDINDATAVTLNHKSLGSGGSLGDECGFETTVSGFSETNIEEGTYQTASLTVLDKETANDCSKRKNNLLKNTPAENRLSPTESNDCKEINVNNLGFQLKLIRKEMKKRDMVVKGGSSMKKSLKVKTASQITKEASDKSSEKVTRKRKLSKKVTKSKPAKNSGEKLSSAEDYISLQVSGPTKFSVAQLNKIKPYSMHKAKNFKNDMLFGKRVNRYSDSRHLQIYLLKKEARKKRK